MKIHHWNFEDETVLEMFTNFSREFSSIPTIPDRYTHEN